MFTQSQVHYPHVQTVREALLADEPLTWLFSGDSLTHQLSPISLVSETMTAVRRQTDRHQDSVVNTLAPQMRLSQLLTEFDRRIARFDPDIAMLFCGPPELADENLTSEDLEQTVRELVHRCQEIGALAILHLPLPTRSAQFSGSVEQLIRLEALRGSGIESGALIVDHWSEWDANADSGWRIPDSWEPSAQGLRAMAELFVQQIGLAQTKSPDSEPTVPSIDSLEIN